MTSAMTAGVARKVVYEPDRAACRSIADALRETARKVPGIGEKERPLLLASKRFAENPQEFRKYDNKHANTISKEDFLYRIEEANAIAEVLAKRLPPDLKDGLEGARGMLLDFSGVNFSQMEIINTEGEWIHHTTVTGADFTNSVWDNSTVDSFTFTACKFNGAGWNNIDVVHCVLIECDGFMIDLQDATIRNSILKRLRWGFANTEELEMHETGIYGLSLGDFPRRNGTYYGREIFIRSSIATAKFLGPAARNFGLDTVSFGGEIFATEAQRNMLLEARRSSGAPDSDIKHLVFTVKEVQKSAEAAGPEDRVYRNAKEHNAEQITKASGS